MKNSVLITGTFECDESEEVNLIILGLLALAAEHTEILIGIILGMTVFFTITLMIICKILKIVKGVLTLPLRLFRRNRA